MGVNGPLHMHHKLSPMSGRTILKSSERRCHWCMKSGNSTSICTDINFLVTDHKPLTTLLGPKKSIPPLAAARLQRWALLLSAYTYEIEWKPTREHANADGLSQLPLQNEKPECQSSTADVVFVIGQVQALPVTAE